METETGKVMLIHGGWMEVKVPCPQRCERCRGRYDCTFDGPEEAYHLVRMVHQPWISRGDLVTFQPPHSARTLLTIVYFVLPPIVIAGAVTAATLLISHPYRQIIGAGIGLAAYFLLWYWTRRATRYSPRFLPSVITVNKTVDHSSEGEIPTSRQGDAITGGKIN